MKKNVLINLIYTLALVLIAIINLIVAFITGDKGEVFFLVFCSIIGLSLMNVGHIQKIMSSNGDNLSKLLKFVMKLLGKIGNIICVIIGLVGIIMGSATVGISNTSNGTNYEFSSTEYQMMLIGFSIIISTMINKGFNKVLLISSNDRKYEFFNNYGMTTIFPIVLGVSYLFQIFTEYFMIGMFLLNAGFIIYGITFKQKSELSSKHQKFNLVMSWVILILPIIINLAFAGAVGVFNFKFDSLEGMNKFGAIFYSSMLLYPCVAFILFICLYFITNRILYKKNSKVSMFGYALVPIISYVIQILVCYYWYVGLIALGVVWVALTILGLSVEIFSSSTSISNISLPKYHDKKYKYKSEIEKQMGYLQSVHTQIRGWNVKEVHGELVIEVICNSINEEFVKGILREYFTNEIRFFYL